MIKKIIINNIILVEEVVLEFSKQLNVFTGETGAGKSALMEALRLVLGQRYQRDVLRHQASEGFVEAYFADGSVLRRELFADGKSKAYSNGQAISIATLQSLTKHLVTVVGQHSHICLIQNQEQREVVDTYAANAAILAETQAHWKRWKEVQKQYELLCIEKKTLFEKREEIEEALREFEEARMKEGEEEELFAEFSRLSNSEELIEKTQVLLDQIFESETPLLRFFKRQQTELEALVSMDEKIKPCAEALERIGIELDELYYQLQQYSASLELDPSRLQYLNERLGVFESMKRKYGHTWEEMQKKKEALSKELERMETFEERQFFLKQQCEESEALYREKAQILSEKRRLAAETLQNLLTNGMSMVRLHQASLSIRVSRGEESAHGFDAIEWLFRPNKGEKELPIKECASGGELSRVLLLVHLFLSQKKAKHALVFDEIDSGIGGETALAVGSVIQQISQEHQLFCITHLPQIATLADAHFSIYKHEQGERTVSKVRLLSQEERKEEVARMFGGKEFVNALA